MAKKSKTTDETIKINDEKLIFNGQNWVTGKEKEFDFENHIFNGQYWEKKPKKSSI